MSIELAILHKEQLIEKYQKNINLHKNRFFNGASWSTYKLDIEDSDYNSIQYVSLNGKGEILGYLSAEINRTSNIITSISVIKFKESTIFSLDLMRFLFLLRDLPVFKIEWCVIGGNPAELLYDKIIKKYGGNKIGRYTKSFKLSDGKYCDNIMYEYFI